MHKVTHDFGSKERMMTAQRHGLGRTAAFKDVQRSLVVMPRYPVQNSNSEKLQQSTQQEQEEKRHKSTTICEELHTDPKEDSTSATNWTSDTRQ